MMIIINGDSWDSDDDDGGPGGDGSAGLGVAFLPWLDPGRARLSSLVGRHRGPHCLHHHHLGKWSISLISNKWRSQASVQGVLVAPTSLVMTASPLDCTLCRQVFCPQLNFDIFSRKTVARTTRIQQTQPMSLASSPEDIAL